MNTAPGHISHGSGVVGRAPDVKPEAEGPEQWKNAQTLRKMTRGLTGGQEKRRFSEAGTTRGRGPIPVTKFMG